MSELAGCIARIVTHRIWPGGRLAGPILKSVGRNADLRLDTHTGQDVLRKLDDKELRIGLHLPGAVCDRDGRILLAAGVCLTETHIKTLIRPSRGGVYARGDWHDDAPAEPSKPLKRGPYLRITSPAIGHFEFDIPARPTTIGRSDEVDIKLADPAVSRTHAIITCEDNTFMVQDLASKLGTTVNGERVTSQLLQHDDIIQISQFILQFQAHAVQTMASKIAAKAEELLCAKFRLLPASMQAEYRILGVPPEKVFEPGDTLRVGEAGLLFPVTDSPGESMCVEVHLKWPTGRERFYLGGIMGVISKFDIHWMCLKLHTVPRKTHEMVVELAHPGPWLDSVRT